MKIIPAQNVDEIIFRMLCIDRYGEQNVQLHVRYVQDDQLYKYFKGSMLLQLTLVVGSLRSDKTYFSLSCNKEITQRVVQILLTQATFESV